MGSLWWLPDDAAGAVPNSRACPSLRASQPPRHWRLERVLNEFFLTGSCSTSLGFAWQRNGRSLNFTSFRGHFSLQRNSRRRTSSPHRRKNFLCGFSKGSKGLKTFCLQARCQAIHETLPPCHRCVLAFVFVSHIFLFTL